MILKVEDLMIKYWRKIELSNISFTVGTDEILSIISENEYKNSAFFHGFKYNRTILDGKIFLDEKDVTNELSQNRKLGLIWSDKFQFTIFPILLKLFYWSLTDTHFLLQAKRKWQNEKNVFDDLLDNGVNLDKRDFKIQLKILIDVFLKNTNHIVKELLEKYSFESTKFHKQWINELIKFDNEKDQKIFRKQLLILTLEEEKLTILQSKLTFTQAMWDKLFSLIALENTCNCEKGFNIKNNRLFRLKEVRFVVNQYLDKFNLDIKEIRQEIKGLKYSLRMYRRLFKKTIKRHYYDTNRPWLSLRPLFVRLKHNFFVSDWKITTFKMREDFINRQYQIIRDILPDEIHILKGSIMERTLVYHQKLLIGYRKARWDDYQTIIKYAERKVIPVWKQILLKLKQILNNLDCYNLQYYFGWQLSRWEKVKLQVIKTLIKGNKVLIIDDRFVGANQKYKLEFIELIKNIKKYYHLPIIIMSKNGSQLLSISNKLYIWDYEANLIQSGSTAEIIASPKDQFVLKSISNIYLNWITDVEIEKDWLKIGKNFIFKIPKQFSHLKLEIAILSESVFIEKSVKTNKRVNYDSFFVKINSIKIMRWGDVLLRTSLDGKYFFNLIITNQERKKLGLKINGYVEIGIANVYIFDQKNNVFLMRI